MLKIDPPASTRRAYRIPGKGLCAQAWDGTLRIIRLVERLVRSGSANTIVTGDRVTTRSRFRGAKKK